MNSSSSQRKERRWILEAECDGILTHRPRWDRILKVKHERIGRKLLNNRKMTFIFTCSIVPTFIYYIFGIVCVSVMVFNYSKGGARLCGIRMNARLESIAGGWSIVHIRSTGSSHPLRLLEERAAYRRLYSELIKGIRYFNGLWKSNWYR